MKKYNTQAIVLKNINYKDKDRIYTLFTRKYGKVSALARGVRKISSRRSGNLDTLNYINVKITEGKNKFRYIDEAETIKSFQTLKENLNMLKKAYYLNEMVYKVLEEDEESQRVFDFLLKVLSMFEKNKIDPEVLISYFEVGFLKLLGYRIPNEKQNTTVQKLESADLDQISVQEIKEVNPLIKSYIYTYLSDKFKSLEL